MSQPQHAILPPASQFTGHTCSTAHYIVLKSERGLGDLSFLCKLALVSSQDLFKLIANRAWGWCLL